MLSLVIDTETTGLDPAADRVVEVGFVLTDWKVIYGALHTYIDPEMGFDNKYNGLNTQSVKGAPTFQELLPFTYMLLLFAEEYIAHNWPFDRRFLQMELSRCSLPLPSRTIYDTMRASGGRTLQEACSKAGVHTEDVNWHSAYDDAVATFRLAKALRGVDPAAIRQGGEAISLVPRF